MTRTIFTLVILLASLAWAAEARALPFRTFVSIAGDDANDCTLNSPCRSFAAAVPKTEAGGEITAVDSGTYFGVTIIDKALTIQAAPGVYAALAAGGTFASPVTVSAGAGDVVVLRNLHVSQMPVKKGRVPTKGIELKSGLALHVESCIVAGFADSGIAFNPINGLCNESGCPKLFVKDSFVRDNGQGLHATGVLGSIDHCRIEDNSIGVRIEVQSHVTIRDSVLAGNTSFGVASFDSLSYTKIDHCSVTNNGTGIKASSVEFAGAAVFYVSNTMISGNNIGLLPSGGQIISFSNNQLADNSTDGAFTSTIAPQ